MAVKNWLQEKLADLADSMTNNLKFILRGKIVVDLKKFEIRFEKAYFVVVDKKTGNDLLKKHLPFKAKIDAPLITEIPIEVKGEFKK